MFKDYDCGSIPRPQRPAFCIFMQLFIVDLSFEKSSNYYSFSVMFNKDYVLDEMRKSEQFADDQKYILDYCMRVRLENKERKERNDKQIPDVSGRQC